MMILATTLSPASLATSALRLVGPLASGLALAAMLPGAAASANAYMPVNAPIKATSATGSAGTLNGQPMLTRKLVVQPKASALGSLQTAATTLNLCNFKLTYDEEFRSMDIVPHTLTNGARWTAHTPWNGDFGNATFTDPGSHGLPFSIGSNGLQIHAYKDATGAWHSGLIAAADASGAGWGVQYGYFEARMKLPAGPGTWPGFWLSSLISYPTAKPAIEVDVMEYYGHDTQNYESSLHVWFQGAAAAQSTGVTSAVPVPAGSLVTAYHDYGVSVQPDYITYYLDHVAVWKQPTPPQLTGPLYPIVDLALGAGYPITNTPNPSMLAVQYVRVYANATSPTC